MNGPELLAEVLSRSDAPEPCFTADEVACWPEGAQAALCKAVLISRDHNAAVVVCDACHEAHCEDVVYVTSPTGSQARAYILCPEAGRVPVPLERLRQWRVDFEGMGAAVARGLELAGVVDGILAGRLWRLGKAAIGGQIRDVFLARGLAWVDAPRVIGSCEQLNRAAGALVIATGNAPADCAWLGGGQSVVPLAAILTLERQALVFDHRYLNDLLGASRRRRSAKTPASFATPAGATWADVTMRVADDGLTVSVMGVRREFSIAEAGFQDGRRDTGAGRIWQLLELFAQLGGIVPLAAARRAIKNDASRRQRLTDLRTRLAALVPGIDGSPVIWHGAARIYRTAFSVASSTGLALPVPNGTRWDGITLQREGERAIRIAWSASERYTVPVYAEEGDGTVRRPELAQRGIDCDRAIDLCLIGLADDKGPTPSGKLLMALLDAGGVLARSAEDRSVLKILEVLNRLIPGADGGALDFVGNKWVACFRTVTVRSQSVISDTAAQPSCRVSRRGRTIL